MATVTIKRDDGGEDPIPADTEFKLRAEVHGGSPSAHQWKRNGADIAGATGAEYKAIASDNSAGSYVVVVTVDGDSVASDAVEVKVKSTPSEEPPEFHARFALWIGVVVAVGAAAVLFNAARAAWGIKKGDLAGAQGDRLLAAALGLPLTLLGDALLALGAWMAVVEWRGRFKPKPAAPPAGGPEAETTPIDIPKVIEAVGKLRGAALLLVVGALLMLGAAWIAKGAAEPEPAGGTTPPAAPSPPSPSPSPSPSPPPPTPTQ